MDLDTLMQRYRLADRELFNHYFHVEDPYQDLHAWDVEYSFRQVQHVLFAEMVQTPADLPRVPYFAIQPAIHVRLKTPPCAALINREINSGYWDHPVKEITQEATLHFVRFFDWDQLSQRDYHYVWVLIANWPEHPDLVGKHALIETMYVRFTKASEAVEQTGTGLHLVPSLD